MLQWPDELDNFVFASHTSLINSNYLIEIFKEEGIIKNKNIKQNNSEKVCLINQKT